MDEKVCTPILVGRPDVLESRVKRYGLRFSLETDVEVVDSEHDGRFDRYWKAYWEMMRRKGVTQEFARLELRRRTTLVGALMVKFGEADGMICGTIGRYVNHLDLIDKVIGKAPGASTYAAMNIILMPESMVAIADTHVNANPNAQELADIAIMAAQEMRHLRIEPKLAFVSSSNFGTDVPCSGSVIREALALVREREPDLEIDGEMHCDAALDEKLRARIMPDSPLKGAANVLICPNVEAGNIAYNLLKVSAGSNVAVGPFLLGMNAPITILTSSSTVRRIVNMAALTVVDANIRK